MTSRMPPASRPVTFGAPSTTDVGSIASVVWHRLALIAIALVVIMVILPTVLALLAPPGSA